MNRKIGAFTAFMIIFSAILIHYFGLWADYSGPHISYADGAECRVFLTFDDGPSDRVTPKILDVLKDEGVKATFFIVGKNAAGREKIIRRELDEGHSIGVHSYSHEYKKIYASPQTLLYDIEKCNDVLEAITGKRCKLYRFPGGSFNLNAGLINAVTGAGYRYVDWNASLRDAELSNAAPYELVEQAKATAAGQKTVVLLCHDGTDKVSTVEALKDVIEYFKSSGYKFETF